MQEYSNDDLNTECVAQKTNKSQLIAVTASFATALQQHSDSDLQADQTAETYSMTEDISVA